MLSLCKIIELQRALGIVLIPMRHALGGLLCEQELFDDGEIVFREELKLHPKNPWTIIGLVTCIENRCKVAKTDGEVSNELSNQISQLTEILRIKQTSKWVDFDIVRLLQTKQMLAK